MAVARPVRQVPLISVCACVLALACSPGASTAARLSRSADSPPSHPKVLNIGVSTELPQLGVLASESTGGWTDLTELHTSSLTTPDTATTRSIGRLAEKVPTIDDGSISLLADGKMRVVYHLRPNVTWQDGAPFSAQDLVFTHTFLLDPGLPVYQRDTVRLIESIEAPDDLTAVFTFAHPFFRGGDLSARDFWPHPHHLLEAAFNRYRSTANADEVISIPYWTSDYVNLGPFRVTAFDPGEGVTFQVYPGFFLGRPKVDTIHVRPFRDENALFANLLAGSIDLFPELALHPELAAELKGRWDQSGDGTVRSLAGTTSFLVPQWRPSVITEPANLDIRVRQALYYAIDRDAFPHELVQPAWSLLPPPHPLYEATKDGLRRYAYDPARARALLADTGWTPGPDGMLRNNTDGRRFQNRISAVASGRLWEVATYADAWRRVGVEVEEGQVSPAQSRDLQFRALYPSWEASSSGYGDMVLNRLTGPAASEENRWSGNRGGYDDPVAQQLIGRYLASMAVPEQLQAMRDLSDFVVTNLPVLLTFYSNNYNGQRKGVTALEDAPLPNRGSRNAHLWDIA